MWAFLKMYVLLYFWTNVSKLKINTHSKYDWIFILIELRSDKICNPLIDGNLCEKRYKTRKVLGVEIEKGYVGSRDQYQSNEKSSKMQKTGGKSVYRKCVKIRSFKALFKNNGLVKSIIIYIIYYIPLLYIYTIIIYSSIYKSIIV